MEEKDESVGKLAGYEAKTCMFTTDLHRQFCYPAVYEPWDMILVIL